MEAFKPGKWWMLFSGLWMFLVLFGALINLADNYTPGPLDGILITLLAVALPPAFALFVKGMWRIFRS